MTTRVALVGPEIEENLSLRYLASALARVGVEVELAPFNHASDMGRVVSQVLACAPTVVGISMAFQWRAPDMLGLAVALREAGFGGHITLGGHFATFAAEAALTDFPEIDSICRQEAEETLVELVQHVAQGRDWKQLAGLSVRLDDGRVTTTAMRHPAELSTLAWPDRRGAPAECFGHRIAPLVSTRGCYANCTFCCIAAWHEVTLPGKRYRERPLEDVADEMAAEHFGRGIDIFVFHDDNFFLPSGVKNAERINRLADLLEARKVKRFATVVKARPTDVQEKPFRALVERLHCIRCYVGIETDADQGLETLQRWAQPKHNAAAMQLVDELGLYTCFNVLLFDPDTTMDSLQANLAFMRRWAGSPFNFGRTELYAGTPLLRRMREENRARGDWLQWDYSMSSPSVERVFQLANAAFDERNFKVDGLANTMMSTRFDVEVVRRFHPEVYRPSWRERARGLSAALGLDSVAGLERIIARVEAREPMVGDKQFVADLAGALRETEQRLKVDAEALAGELESLVEGKALTRVGDRVATPLQKMTHAAPAEVSP
jgi:radical SAM superfamily enzyme YgiQ (UPF0313 family)